jgi:hypothetical protein
MTAIELRTQLKRLIDAEQDESLLQYALRILKGEDQEALFKAKMRARADRSEMDIAAGRVYTSDQVREEILKRIRK